MRLHFFNSAAIANSKMDYCSRRNRATDELSHIVSPQAIILLISKVFIRDIIFDAVECKTVDSSSKPVKKSVKRGVRVLRALTARASHV